MNKILSGFLVTSLLLLSGVSNTYAETLPPQTPEQVITEEVQNDSEMVGEEILPQSDSTDSLQENDSTMVVEPVVIQNETTEQDSEEVVNEEPFVNETVNVTTGSAIEVEIIEPVLDPSLIVDEPLIEAEPVLLGYQVIGFEGEINGSPNIKYFIDDELALEFQGDDLIFSRVFDEAQMELLKSSIPKIKGRGNLVGFHLTFEPLYTLVTNEAVE